MKKLQVVLVDDEIMIRDNVINLKAEDIYS